MLFVGPCKRQQSMLCIMISHDIFFEYLLFDVYCLAKGCTHLFSIFKSFNSLYRLQRLRHHHPVRDLLLPCKRLIQPNMWNFVYAHMFSLSFFKENHYYSFILVEEFIQFYICIYSNFFHLYFQDADPAVAPPADALPKAATAPVTQASVKTKIV